MLFLPVSTMRSRSRRVNSGRDGKDRGPSCWTTSLGTAESVIAATAAVGRMHGLQKRYPVRSKILASSNCRIRGIAFDSRFYS